MRRNKDELVVMRRGAVEEMIERAVMLAVREIVDELAEDVRQLKENLPIHGYMTQHQLARQLEVTPQTVRRYVREEGLPARKVGHNLLIDKEDWTEWLESGGTESQ